MKRLATLLFVIFCCACGSASAITGTVYEIVVPKATDVELYDRPLRFGTIVQRSATPSDVRIGDGITLGGLPFGGSSGLAWPLVANGDVSLGSWKINMTGGFSMNSEANRFTIWHGTNYALQIVKTDVSASSNLLGVSMSGSNLVFTVASDTDSVVVESTASLTNPVWENVTVSVVRTTPLIVEVRTTVPPLEEFRYYRVRSTVSGIGMYVSVPLFATAVGIGGINITSNVVENWNTSYSWGSHSAAGYATVGSLTGYVGKAETNGWETVSHAGLATGTPVYAESDPLWAAWRTNAAAGTTNAIRPDGSLVDISALLVGLGYDDSWTNGRTSAFYGDYGGITNPPDIPANAAITSIAQTVATSYGFAPTGSVVLTTGATMTDGAMIAADGDFTLSGAGASIFFGTDPYLSGWRSIGASNIAAGTSLTVNGHAVLTQETDAAWAAWRTNAAAGTTNAVLPNGSLVDVGGILAAKVEAPQAGQIASNVVGHGLAGYFVVDYATSVALNPSNGYRQGCYLAGTTIVSVAGGGTNQMGSFRFDVWTGTNQHLFTNPVPAGTWSTTAVNTVLYSKPAHATAWTARVFQW